MWVNLLILVLSSIISNMLAPKPPAPKAAGLADFTVPTAEENRAIPVVFGKVWVSGPNVVWYGDLTIQAIYGEGKK